MYNGKELISEIVTFHNSFASCIRLLFYIFTIFQQSTDNNINSYYNTKMINTNIN